MITIENVRVITTRSGKDGLMFTYESKGCFVEVSSGWDAYKKQEKTTRCGKKCFEPGKAFTLKIHGDIDISGKWGLVKIEDLEVA